MSDATYVAFVPAKKRDRLREMLQTEDTGPLEWHERRAFSGSEFYFSGPAALARRAHAYVTEWVIAG
jgi:hypothetical protein